MMLYSVFLGAIVIWRVILPLKVSRGWKIALAIITALIAFKFYIMRIFSGELFFTPEIPGWILVPVTWLFAALMFFSLWVIVWEIIVLTVRIVTKVRKKKLPLIFTRNFWKLAGLVSVAILVTIGMYEGLKTPAVTEYRIVLKDLPGELDGLKIIHLTDIHADPFTTGEKIQRIVDLSNAQKADLIVITGEFVDGKTAVRGKDLECLRQLNAPLGVFGVPGNHEYYSGYTAWMDFLRGCGVRMLENRNVLICDGKISLGGVTDPAAGRRGGELPDVAKTFADVPEDTLRILLAHQPKLALEAAANSVDLQLSGHTHGGMIYGLDLLVGKFNHGFVSGTYDVGKMKLHVSNGTGIWNGFPLRLGHPSEIVLLTLVSE